MATKGSNKLKCQAYKSRSTRETNKRIKLNKHLVKHPSDFDATKALNSL